MKTIILTVTKFQNMVFTNFSTCGYFTAVQILYQDLTLTNLDLHIYFDDEVEFSILFDYPSSISQFTDNSGIYIFESHNYTEIYPIEFFEIIQVDFQRCFKNGAVISVVTGSELCLYVEPTGCSLNLFRQQKAAVFYQFKNQFIYLDIQDGSSNSFKITQSHPQVSKNIFSSNMKNPYLESNYYCMSCENLDDVRKQQCINKLSLMYQHSQNELNLILYDDGQQQLSINVSFQIFNTNLTCQSDLKIVQAKIIASQLFIEFQNSDKFIMEQRVNYIVQLNIKSVFVNRTGVDIKHLFDNQYADITCFSQTYNLSVNRIAGNNLQLDLDFNINQFLFICNQSQYQLGFSFQITTEKNNVLTNTCFLISYLEIDLQPQILLTLYNQYLCSNQKIYGQISIVYEGNTQQEILLQQIYNFSQGVTNLYHENYCVKLKQTYELLSALNILSNEQIDKYIVVYINDGNSTPIRVQKVEVNYQVNLARNMLTIPVVILGILAVTYMLLQVDINTII